MSTMRVYSGEFKEFFVGLVLSQVCALDPKKRTERDSNPRKVQAPSAV